MSNGSNASKNNQNQKPQAVKNDHVPSVPKTEDVTVQRLTDSARHSTVQAEKNTKVWILLGAILVAGIFFFQSIGAFADDAKVTVVTIPQNGVEEAAEDAAASAKDAADSAEDAKAAADSVTGTDGLKASFFERASKAWDYAVNDTDGQLAEIAKREAKLAEQETDLAAREEKLTQDMLVRSVELNSTMGQAEMAYHQLTQAVSALSKCVLQANDDLTRPTEPEVPVVAK